MRFRFLMRAEAVNLHAFLDDTPDLSTIRGGGLALLEAPRIIGELLHAEAPAGVTYSTTAISRGASVGLWQLELDADSAAAAATLAASWRERLSAAMDAQATTEKNPDEACVALTPATLVVDVVPLEEGVEIGEAVERATAANRWRQLQQGSVRWPEQALSEKVRACGLDGVRPGNVPEPAPDGQGTRMLSRATWDRRWFGRGERQELYQSVCEHKTARRFSNSFEELTSHPPTERLAGKMAVIHADGNDFGSLVRSLRTVEQRRAFDTRLREQQGAMLRQYLVAREKALAGANGVLPIETLLWGGDEATWVVPAWHAWEFLANLFEYPFEFELPGPSGGDVRRIRPSFGVGVVFCHDSAPIRRIKELALALSEVAKGRGKRDGGNALASAQGGAVTRHYASFVAYEVLESFDSLGVPVKEYRENRAAEAGVRVEQMLLPGDGFRALIQALSGLMCETSGSVINCLGKPGRSAPERERALASGQDSMTRAKASYSQLRSALETLEKDIGTAVWSHLVDLRDYLIPVAPEHS